MTGAAWSLGGNMNAQAAQIIHRHPQHDADCPGRCRSHECHKPPGRCTCPLGSAREVRAAAVKMLAAAHTVKGFDVGVIDAMERALG